jgi:hypothetical protein
MKEKSISLEEYVGGHICRGVLSGYDNAFVIDEKTRTKLIRKDKRSHEIIKPYLMGRDVGRYSPLEKGRYLIFTRRGIDIENYPAVKAHLMDYQGQLAPKPRTYKGEWKGRKSGSYRWFEIQDSVDYFRELEKPKIIYLKFQVKPAFTLDMTGFYPNSAVWAIPVDDKYLLGLLNSSIGWFLISKYCTRIQGGYQLIWEYFKQLPIRTIDFTNESEKAKHDHIVSLVEQMLKAKEELASAKLDSDIQRLEHRCATLDHQIDEAVYELYGLTEEEIKIVEGKN